MKSLKVIIGFSVLFSALFSQANEIPFSANDLAIMFPLNPSTNLPKQPVNLVTPGWQILSQQNFTAVMAAARTHDVFLNDKLTDIRNWYVVAMRYAPCTIFAGQSPNCKEQIRFVLQPHNAIRGNGFDDYAMHVIYNYNQSPSPQPSPRLESFRRLKNEFGAAVSNKTLKPSPILDSDKGAAYLTRLQQEVIATHVLPQKAGVVTFMGLANFNEPGMSGEDPHDWRFFAGELNAAGVWQNTQLPTGHQASFQQFKIEDEGGFIFNINPIAGQPSLMVPSSNTEDDIRAAVASLDMRKTNDHNVDCASCHMADRYMFSPAMDDTPAAIRRFMRDMNTLIGDNKRITEVVINPDIHVGKNGSEFPIPRIFGYLDGSALISQRMVIDNAISVSYANQMLQLNVVPQCTGPGKREAFLRCLYFGEFGATVTQCLRQHCF